eukprot:TRINITY_DN17656_c0_g1_i1.p1 TRINITY_DN17656_c0_g1~~TRINITY_DN17656_c0_g1_i1.p1  ORF type:complete len:721 (-),score=70.61 TRINITY_DN17656_c0_g1_i1:334-2496(-)
MVPWVELFQLPQCFHGLNLFQAREVAVAEPIDPWAQSFQLSKWLHGLNLVNGQDFAVADPIDPWARFFQLNRWLHGLRPFHGRDLAVDDPVLSWSEPFLLAVPGVLLIVFVCLASGATAAMDASLTLVWLRLRCCADAVVVLCMWGAVQSGTIQLWFAATILAVIHYSWELLSSKRSRIFGACFAALCFAGALALEWSHSKFRVKRADTILSALTLKFWTIFALHQDNLAADDSFEYTEKALWSNVLLLASWLLCLKSCRPCILLQASASIELDRSSASVHFVRSSVMSLDTSGSLRGYVFNRASGSGNADVHRQPPSRAKPALQLRSQAGSSATRRQRSVPRTVQRPTNAQRHEAASSKRPSVAALNTAQTSAREALPVSRAANSQCQQFQQSPLHQTQTCHWHKEQDRVHQQQQRRRSSNRPQQHDPCIGSARKDQVIVQKGERHHRKQSDHHEQQNNQAHVHQHQHHPHSGKLPSALNQRCQQDPGSSMEPHTSAAVSTACVNASSTIGRGVLLTTPEGPLARPFSESTASEPHQAIPSPLQLSVSVRNALELRKERLTTQPVLSVELGQPEVAKNEPFESLRGQRGQYPCKSFVAGKENMVPAACETQEKASRTTVGIVAAARTLCEKQTSSHSPSSSGSNQLGDLRNLAQAGRGTMGMKSHIYVDPEFQPMFVNEAEFAMFCERTENVHHEVLAAFKHRLKLAKSKQRPGAELAH